MDINTPLIHNTSNNRITKITNILLVIIVICFLLNLMLNTLFILVIRIEGNKLLTILNNVEEGVNEIKNLNTTNITKIIDDAGYIIEQISDNIEDISVITKLVKDNIVDVVLYLYNVEQRFEDYENVTQTKLEYTSNILYQIKNYQLNLLEYTKNINECLCY